MSQNATRRIDYGTDETLDDSTAVRQGKRDVAELQKLFEDVTGTKEVVEEQEDTVSSRDITDESSMSAATFDDGLVETIDEPDVDNAF